MFKWLKNLFSTKKLLPKDIENGLMTSMFCSVKFGEKLIVPEKCICFLSYRDKIYNKFEQGEYVLNEKTLQNLIEKQLKTNSQTKNPTIKFDLFYVNLGYFNSSTKQVENIPYNHKLTKFEIKTNFACHVIDADKFKNYALSFFALIRPIDAQNLINDFVIESINRYYIKQKFSSPIDTISETNNVKTHINKKAEKYGFELINFNMSIFPKAKLPQKSTNVSFFENNSTKTNSNNVNQQPITNKTSPIIAVENIDNSKHKEYNLNDVEQTKSTTEQVEKHMDICPNCQTKRIANSIFCHKCGYKF